MARPQFIPTDEQRRTVRSLSAYGIKQDGIARVLHFRSSKTLRKHFREELDIGEIEAVAQVAQMHYQMAKSGKHPASTMHFLEKRQRWLQVQAVEAPDFIVEVEKDAA